MSAVSSVSTPGVLVTVMPRRSAEVTSIWSTPLPKLAISFICSPAWAIMPALMGSVMVGTSTSASRIASAISLSRHRLVVEVEPRVEQLAHAGLDEFGQLAGDDDEGLLLGHEPFPPRRPRRRQRIARFQPRSRAISNALTPRLRRAAQKEASQRGHGRASPAGRRSWRRRGLSSRWRGKDKDAGVAPSSGSEMRISRPMLRVRRACAAFASVWRRRC